MILYTRTVLAVLLLFSISPVFSQSSADTTASFTVHGACGQCKQRIEKALKIKGVNAAKWDVFTQQLTVQFDTSVISLPEIHNKLVAAGHDTELKKATDKVYQALPDCCHYRELAPHLDMPDGDHAPMDLDAPAHNNHIMGVVLSEDKKGNLLPLNGASILWLDTQTGTTTDEHGVFILPKSGDSANLVISYTGFKADTVDVSGKDDLQIVLASRGELQTVQVFARQRGTYVNAANAFRIATITSKELLKAACCNLSESFETNPSVDVTYNDAVTGSKQIQLLGLSGIYTQLTVENLPGPRGLATPLGLNSISGTWVESMQLSKGTGSVVNGFESIAGQINVELKKPENSEALYANGYINTMGKTDLNLNLSRKVGDKWSTALLLHNAFLYNKTDFNKDGFRDLPTGNQFAALHRWKFDNGKGLMFQFGAKAMIDDKTGGELDYNASQKFSTDNYGLGINTKRFEGWAKIGYVFPAKKYRSIGLQLSGFSHKQDAYFGLIPYNGEQTNFYSNLIYQDIIGNTAHKFRTGLSFVADKYDELYKTQRFRRDELVSGAFFEYTYTMNDRFDVVAGIRADHNSLFGWFATPRLNFRYEPVKGTVIRAGAGRGQRTANIFAENMGTLVSSRQVMILGAVNGKAYGLNPEVAWNKGISVDQKFRLFHRDANLGVEFYRNDFSNQVIADMEDPSELAFYNLNGKSFSNSFQTEFYFSPLRNLDMRLAYRWFDVKSTYDGKLLQRPLISRHRGFANLAYETGSWKFDYTLNIMGPRRIPSTTENPVAYRLSQRSPAYVTMNAQVSKSFGKNKAFELYLGGENLTNYFQQNAIIAAADPFSKYFDASLIWGPVTGRQVYAGFRYTIK